jgi:type II secretory pathway component PulK
LEERDDEYEEIGPAVLTLAILVALAGIILAVAIAADLAWRRHSDFARLEHRAAALQQANPTSGR